MTDQVSMQERRRELLRRRIAASGAASAPTAPASAASTDLPQVRPGQRYGLSAGQRRMWFVQALDAADPVLNVCVAYRLTGALDPERLRTALTAVAARHTILRTRYGVDDAGEPYQQFRDDAEIGWLTEDLIDIAESERDGRVAAAARAEFGRPFDLTAEPPLRAALLRTGADRWVLLLTIHHICWDDDCWEVFFGELNAAYNNTPLTGHPAPFVAIEALGASDDATAADLAYWREALQPLPEPLDLPGPAPADPSRRAQRRRRALPAALLDRVEGYAREQSATPFMVLLAAFGALMRRYTGAADLLVAIPVTERKAVAEHTIGYFGDTLLIRLTPDPRDTFGSLLEKTRDTCLAGFAHRSVGIDRVVREANPQRSAGHDGLDQLVRLGFSMRKSASDFAFDGVTATELELGAATTQLPLTLMVVPEPDGMSVEVEYQADVLAAPLIEQMLGHYLHLLDGALSEPQRRIAVLDLFDAGGRAAVLAQSHGELVAAPATTLVALLETAAAATPDATALIGDDTRLSYNDLHRRANRLARWLIGKGIGTEDIVGLRMTTSVEFVVVALAVLKAGAAYLPIDPAHPDDRIEYLIADTDPRMVIGREGFGAAEAAAARLPDGMLTDAERIRPLLPGNLAYIIYTSGSTGRPKGVAVAHAAIAEHIDGFAAEWTMTAQDRFLQSSSVSFDASLADIFVTLANGAGLVVPHPGAVGDLGQIGELIDRHGVTVLHMVPSMLSTLLLLPDADRWRGLRHVPVGGEALPGLLADEFVGRFDAELRNHYGPTEAVVCATHLPVNESYGNTVVPIGVPNRNVYAYVLDVELQLVPAEVVGELYLGGDQLARGYLGRPGMTAERFVADPFHPGGRLYRTGDLVRRNHRGQLEFVGRADEQVKIRGFRIELGEIESVITAHPAVQRCVVVAENTDFGPELTAFVVPAGRLDLDELRAHAAAKLPAYMLPHGYALIPRVPLTVSGKLDKRALPTPTRVAERGHREPTTPTERRVSAIFAALFGGARVGADDSFFELGGHSLLAARLVAQIRAEFGVDLPVRTVFDAPTPAALAGRLVAQFRTEFDIDLDTLDADDAGDAAGDAAGERPQLRVAQRPDRPPLSHSQAAMWFQHRLRGGDDIFNVGLALRINGPLDTAALTAAVNDVVSRHEALRTDFPDRDGVPYQRVHPARDLELTVRAITADRLDATVAELRRRLFDLESEPLIRPTLLVLGPDAHVLLLLMHHMVTDHSSLGVLFDDLLVAYRARLRGTAPWWTDAPVQFVDYALWQHTAFGVDSPWGAAQLAHWRDALAAIPAEIALAHDRVRPPVLRRNAEVVTCTVPAARRAALTEFAERTGVTEFMVYQAAVAVLLHTLGGGTDIPVGSPVAARIDPAAANLIGPCANVVVLRNNLAGDPTLRDTVTRGRDVVLDALEHQELPTERVVEALNPVRSPARDHPLFQAAIQFRGDDWALQPRDLTGTGETTVTPLPMEFERALLDLSVVLTVSPEGGLDVRLVANADLYQRRTVQLIAEALVNAFDAVVTTPDRPLSRVELLPAAAMAELRTGPVAAAAVAARPLGAGSAQTERTLIVLLEELLEITGVNREDNFFALGGDSIISVQWSARAATRDLILTPAMVFEHLTIGELAAAVDTATAQATADPVPAPAEPMSASGLDADALAALTASWQRQP